MKYTVLVNFSKFYKQLNFSVEKKPRTTHYVLHTVAHIQNIFGGRGLFLLGPTSLVFRLPSYKYLITTHVLGLPHEKNI